MRTSGRRRFVYAARFVYPAFITLIAVFAYLGISAEMNDQLGAVSTVVRLERLQTLAPALTIAVGVCQFGLLAFLAPIFTAAAVTEERRAGTLSALMTTPMTSGQIILGKLTSRVVQLLILAMTAAPLLLIIRVFGGVETEVILALFAVSLTAAVFAASLALMFSVWHRKATGAAVFAYLTFFLISAGPAAVAFAFAASTNMPPPAWAMALSAAATVGVIAEATLDTVPTYPIREVWPLATLINLALATAAVTYARFALRRQLIREAGGEGTGIGSDERPRARDAKALAAQEDKGETAAPAVTPVQGRSRTVSDRPILWRELRQAAIGSWRITLIFAGVVAAGLAWLYATYSFEDTIMHETVAILVALAVLVQATLATTGAVAAERESRAWDVLLTTALSAREILLGKLAGSLCRMWLPIGVLTLHLGIGIGRGLFHPILAFQLAVSLLGATLFLTGSGLLLSLLMRRSTFAAAANMFLAVLLFLVAPLAAGVLPRLLAIHNNDSVDWARTVAIVANPVLVAYETPSAAIWVRNLRHLPVYSMPGGPIDGMAFTLLLTLVAAVQAAVGTGFIALSLLLFHRRGGRAS